MYAYKLTLSVASENCLHRSTGSGTCHISQICFLGSWTHGSSDLQQIWFLTLYTYSEMWQLKIILIWYLHIDQIEILIITNTHYLLYFSNEDHLQTESATRDAKCSNKDYYNFLMYIFNFILRYISNDRNPQKVSFYSIESLFSK